MNRFIVPAFLLVLLLQFPVSAADPAAEEPEPGTLLQGQVLDLEGKPVSGAVVLAVSREAKPEQKPRHVLSSGRGGGESHPVAEAVTDEEGRFTVEVRGAGPFLLRAEAEEIGSAQEAGIEEGDRPTLTLIPGWTVWGQVLDKRTGAPIAGADVYARSVFTDGFADEEHRDRFRREVVTDDDGIFEFANLEQNYYRILAVADGYTEDLVTDFGVGLEGTAPEPVYLYLVPGVTIVGSVTAEDGAPVEKARVSVRPGRTIPNEMRRWARSGGFGARTEEDGSYEIRGIPVASSYVVEIVHEDHAPALVTGIKVREGGRSRPVESVLTPGTSATARLVEGDRPFQGKLRVTVQYPGRTGRVTPTIYRGGDDIEWKEGKWTAHRLTPGKATIVIEADGFPGITRDGVVLPEDEPLDLGDLVLESGPRITGRVVGPEGKAIPGAEIEAMSFGTGTMSHKTANAGEKGEFRIAGLPEVDFTVSAEAKGFGRESVQNVKPGDDPVEIRLQEAGRIRGRVLVGDPPEPLAGFTVESEGKEAESLPFQLKMVGLFQAKATFREPTGEFVLGGLSEGSYKLKVVGAGYIDTRLDGVEVAAGETTDLGDIYLERGVTVSGTVREKGTGDPVGGASVEIEPPGMFNMRAFTEINRSSLTTGPDGAFTLSGLPPGKHTVKVQHDEYSTAKQEIAIVAAAPPADITVELGSGGAIEGTLRNKQGEPVAGGMVMAMLGFAPDPNAMGSTDEYGHFRIDHLAPGTYRVIAMNDPSQSGGNQQELLSSLQMQTAEVVDGKTAVVNIPPDTGAIVVDGTVRKGAERVEARLVWVRLASDGQTPEDFAMAVSDASGSYQVRLTGPGEYRVSVQPMDREADMSNPGMTLKVEIPEEGKVVRDLVIPEIVLAGTVLDAATGERLSGVQVTAMEHEEDRPLRESVLGSSTRTDEEGAYVLEGLAEDTYQLVFSKEGYGVRTLEPVELDGDDTEEGMDIALEPADSVTVHVTDADDNPVEGAWVTSQEYPPMVIAGTTGQTDMNGAAVLTGLVEGTCDIGVIAAGYAPRVVTGVLVPTGRGEPVAIVVDRGESLAIHVVDAEDRPVSNATVRVLEENGPDLSSMILITAMFEGRGMLTDGGGDLRIANLSPGRYELEVRWQDLVVRDKVRIEAGKDNRVEVSF